MLTFNTNLQPISNPGGSFVRYVPSFIPLRKLKNRRGQEYAAHTDTDEAVDPDELAGTLNGLVVSGLIDDETAARVIRTATVDEEGWVHLHPAVRAVLHATDANVGSFSSLLPGALYFIEAEADDVLDGEDGADDHSLSEVGAFTKGQAVVPEHSRLRDDLAIDSDGLTVGI